jgi:hypothetical protein
LIDQLRHEKRKALERWQLDVVELARPAVSHGAHALLEADELARRLQRGIAACPRRNVLPSGSFGSMGSPLRKLPRCWV